MEEREQCLEHPHCRESPTVQPGAKTRHGWAPEPGGCSAVQESLCSSLLSPEGGLWMSPRLPSAQAQQGQGLPSPGQDLTFSQVLVQNCLMVALTKLRGCPPVRFRK